MATATAPVAPSPPLVGRRGRRLAAAGVVLLAHLPLLVAHGQRLWAAPQYQFFPLLFVAAGLLAWRAWPRDAPPAPGPSWPFVAAWAALAVSVALFSAWGVMLAALLGLAAWCVARGGWPLLRRMAPAGLMLALLLPVPYRVEQPLLLRLQSLATGAADPALDALDVPHLVAGNVIAGPEKSFFIQEACSGIDSLVAALACVLFFLLWTRRPVVHGVLLLAATAAWVLLANVLRIVLVVGLQVSRGIDLSAGWRHDALGAALFVVAMLLVLSTDRLLMVPRLMLRRAPPPGPADGSGDTAPLAPTLPAAAPRAVWGVVAAYALLILVQADWFAGLARGGGAAFGTVGDAAVRPLPELGADYLPQRVGPFARAAFRAEHRDRKDINGAESQSWTYRTDAAEATAALDYAFVGWHQLTLCYELRGWAVRERVVRGDEVEVRLEKPTADPSHAYLFYRMTDGAGRPLEPLVEAPPLGGAGALARGLEDRAGRLAGLFRRGAAEAPTQPVSYQTQLFVTSERPLSDGELEAARDLFRQSGDALAAAVKRAN